jgi:hypothetical protein
MKNVNVLVYPADTEIALEINNALKYNKAVHLSGASPTSQHGRLVYQPFIPYVAGPAENTDFLTTFNQLLRQHQIDFIFPGSDDLALYFCEHASELAAEVIGSDLTTTRIARSKRATYDFLAAEPFLPRYYADATTVKQFPVFVKPVIGAGSFGAEVIPDAAALTAKLADGQDYLISEYLPGKEYTIDCFTDRHGVLRFSGCRERCRTRNGITVSTHSQPLPAAVAQIAQRLNQLLHFRGVWFFQVKQNQAGDYRLMEIATRVAGTMCLYRNQGINLPLLSLHDRLGEPITIQQNQFALTVDRALSNKFQLQLDYQTVLVDFDDTITRGQQVNPLMMYLLYQFQNEGKAIILVTRHANDITQTLAQLHIDPNLFQQIHHLTANETKGPLVRQYPDPIFIDDSFGERQNVLAVAGCPVFDTSALEALMHWT